MNLLQLDAAIAAHLAHGAMTGADPLTDSLFDQLEAPAAEGALPAGPVHCGLTDAQRIALAAAEQDPALRWLLPLGALAGLLGTAASVAGWLPW
jgi:hypothetical protein